MERDDRTMQSEIGERNLGTDVTAEFTLPDYKPEIKRLLRVKAVLLPLDRYIGGSAAELSGTVEFQALYAANDGSLWCVTQREDYRFSCPLDLTPDFSTANGLACDVRVDAENVTGRVSAPRKLTARCRVHAKVRTLADRSASGDLPADETFVNTTERLLGTFSSARVYFGESAPLTLSDEILLDGKDPVRVISAESEVFPNDVQTGSGVVTCRGEVCLSLLCVAEAAEAPSLDQANDCVPASAPAPYVVVRRLPFAAEIPVDGAEVNCACCAWGTCSEVEITVEEGRILCDVTCTLFARAERNEEIPYTRDLYSTVCKTESVFRHLPTAHSLACRNGNFSLTSTLTLAEAGIRPDAQVIDTDVSLSAATPETTHGGYVLTGTSHFRVLLRAADGEYTTAEFDLPFRYETQVPTNGSDTDATSAASDSIVRAVMSRVRVDGERVAAEAEIAVALSLRSEGEVSVLSEVRLGESVPVQGAACVVCYPAPSDTLWSVARRYHVPISSLLTKNHLAASPAADAAESLSDIPFLVV